MLRDGVNAGLFRNARLLALLYVISLMPTSQTAARFVDLDDTGSIQKYEEAQKSQHDFAILRVKAEAGDAESQFALGTRLSNGFNFDKDGKPITNYEAVYWLRKAANQGHAGARARVAQIDAQKSSGKVDVEKVQARSQDSGFVAFDKPSASEKKTAAPITSTNHFDKYDSIPPEQDNLPTREGSVEVVPPKSIVWASGITLLSVALGLICSYVLWTILGKSVEGVSPVKTGRRWMNWVVMLTCIAPIIKYFSQMLGGYGKPGNILAQGVAGTIVLAGMAFVTGVLWAHFRNRKSDGSAVPATLFATSPTVPDSVSPAERLKPATDNEPFAMAAEELDTGKMDKGLWARLFAESDGDEAKTKARYIKVRAEQIAEIAPGDAAN